jgi:hypothetical protein
MPLWYNFIVNDDLPGWGVIAAYDEDSEAFYLWTPTDEVCLLTPDWKSDNKDDNINGFFVSESEEGPCPFVEEIGYTYASYTFDAETQDPISITGPWGQEWSILEEDEFTAQYPYYFEYFNLVQLYL